MYTTINDRIRYIGVDDVDLDFFEGQYDVPEGMSYNSYLILDQKIAVMDTVDIDKVGEWEAKLDAALCGKTPDYLVSLHLEPDHSAGITRLMEKYPSCKLVLSKKASAMLPQFSTVDTSRVIAVAEGDNLSLGEHNLTFMMAPMVHWPEVMVAYESTDKVLFSADAFGKFGAICNETDDWACEARRYYFNICGKYGVQVQALLKKCAPLEIGHIAPLHGPVLSSTIPAVIELYKTWSAYEAETSGVFIAYASFHGGTEAAARLLAAKLEEAGVKVAISDLLREDIHECVEDAFRYDRMVVAAPTYDGGYAPAMEHFLGILKAKGYRNRKVGIIENGSWMPMAAKLMRAVFETMKDVTILDPVVSILTSLKDETALDQLVEALK